MCPTPSRSRPSTATGSPRRPSGSRRARSCARSTSWPTALAAVKDGSEPRMQLEMALLKATQPQADLSLQTLIFRIEQLERRLGGEPAAEAPAEEAASAPAPQAAPQRGGGGPSAAVAVEAARGGGPAADRGARARADQGPVAGGGGRGRRGERHARRGRRGRAAGRDRGRHADGRVPRRRRLRQEEGGGQPGPAGRRGARPHRTLAGPRLRVERRGERRGAATLDHEQLIERLRAEFGAEEVFEEPDEERQ